MTQAHVNNFKLYVASSLKLKDKLILTILFDLGVRKFEVKKVIEGYFRYSKSEFNIIGKHQQTRKIFLTHKIIELIELAKTKYSQQEISKWASEQTVYRVTKKCFNYIGYNGACHDFRRHFAQNLDEHGQRLTVIKTLMGHKNINTTSTYIRQSDAELREVINNQHFVKQTIDTKMYHELVNTKMYHELVNKLYKSEQTLHNNNDMINQLLNQISELTEQNQILNKQHDALLVQANKNKDNDRYFRCLIKMIGN